MILSPGSQLVILIPATFIIVHLIYRFIRHRTFTDFILMILLLFLTAFFLLEILYLQWPLLDLALAIAIGVTSGLHGIRYLKFPR